MHIRQVAYTGLLYRAVPVPKATQGIYVPSLRVNLSGMTDGERSGKVRMPTGDQGSPQRDNLLIFNLTSMCCAVLSEEPALNEMNQKMQVT